VLPSGHRLTKLKRIKPADFAGVPFISFPGGSALRERIDGIFNSARVERIISAEASLGASICAMVGAGLGVSVINPVAAEEERIKAGIEIRPFAPVVPAVIGLLYPPYHTRSRLASVFAQCAREVVREEMGMFDRHRK
jgi:DNA-binding transcriptional LysR family regulator